MDRGGFDHGDMASKPKEPTRRRPQRPHDKLYIGEWIAALRMKQREVSKAAKVNEGYLSELVAGKNKVNPSQPILASLGAAMGIPWHYFYKPPPRPEAVQEALTIDPQVLLRLMPPKPPYD